MADDFKRILITRMKFIGDIVLTTPLIRSVRRAYPGAYIAYMGEKQGVSLLEANPQLNEIIPFDFARPAALEQSRVAWLLRRRRFDLALDLFSNPRSALLVWLSGARVRVGQDRKGRGALYTVRVRDDGRPKTPIAFHNQSLQAVGITPVEGPTEIVLRDAERQQADELLEREAGIGIDEPVVGLHPGGTWPAKLWGAGRFGALAARVAEGLGARVVFTSGPNDADALRTALAASSGRAVALPVIPLRMLAAVIARCRAYVCNDAGPMHISAAVGTPTVGIFGPGEENIWFPYAAEQGHTALRKDVPCHPCHLDICNKAGEGFMACMKLVTVEEVYGAAERAYRSHP